MSTKAIRPEHRRALQRIEAELGGLAPGDYSADDLQDLLDQRRREVEALKPHAPGLAERLLTMIGDLVGGAIGHALGHGFDPNQPRDKIGRWAETGKSTRRAPGAHALYR